MSKFFVIDPEEAQTKYQFRPNGNPFTELPFGLRLDTDLLVGFKRATAQNQSIQAFQYLGFILDLLDEAIGNLESSKTAVDPVVEKPAKRTTAKAVESEDVSS